MEGKIERRMFGFLNTFMGLRRKGCNMTISVETELVCDLTILKGLPLRSTCSVEPGQAALIFVKPIASMAIYWKEIILNRL